APRLIVGLTGAVANLKLVHIICFRFGEPVFLENSFIFFSEGFPSMVHILIPDVCPNGFKMRWTDREGPISSLPAKLLANDVLIINPM
ncbi:MAG: hypothetical protein QME74_04185, partial [Candidatus Edwardsbacteria bacterium]|nr:hypothetical protein [Candidatus Edwardsbacteria bacterium]